jgi:hypothetical protein
MGMDLMRTVLLALLVTVVAAPASARGPGYVGIWGVDKKTCTQKGPPDERLKISIKKVRGYESACDITKSEPGKWPGVWYVTSSCAGEGQKWVRRDIYAVRGKGGKRLVIVGDQGHGISYVRCR